MKNILAFLLLGFTSAVSAQATKIAFGSCARQQFPLKIFDTICTHNPSHFIFLGDNIYADTEDPQVMKAEYDSLAMKPGYQRLRDSTIIWAIWDDHDYGINDGGKEYPVKEESKEIFLDFFNEPADSKRRKHPGIYTSYQIKEQDLDIQVILLDTRTFRDSLMNFQGSMVGDSNYFFFIDYQPHIKAGPTILGRKQWKWLKKEFKKDADVRIVCSSIQFGHSYNGFESWNNFPAEKEKMIQLISKTEAEGVVFLTGDVHFAEISKLETENCYPIYDVTSSGLSSKLHFTTANENRIAGPIQTNNFGFLQFEKTENDWNLFFQIIDKNNVVRSELHIPLSTLAF